MNINELPKGEYPKALDFPYFPTKQQAFIWRNWEIVPVLKLAEVLETVEQNILNAACEMGLNIPPRVNESWLKHGYLTVIRNNWHLLDYEQLLQLLGWNAEKMAYTLKEEDFLWSKMGRLKPACEKLKFRALNNEEKNKTAELKKNLLKHFPVNERNYIEKPFSFISRFEKKERSLVNNPFDFNFLHPVAASYGDIFLEDEKHISDNLLEQYASLGVKGIWLQVILYKFHPIRGAEEFSKGYKTRLRNLLRLVNRCAKFDIKVYLYLNEPRCMPDAFYQKFPEWKGVVRDGEIAPTNCTSQTDNPVKWLEDACAEVFAKAPGLGGAFFVTMNENPTHCYSRFSGSECPYCKKRPAPEVIAEVLCAAERGIHAAAPKAKVIIWDWSWRPRGELASDPDLDFEYEILKKLPHDIYFMCTSEWGKEVNIGGIKERVMDYSISQIGPSNKSVKLWKYAKELGMKTVAKIQINNSWEFSATPYIPVPYLIKEHLDNLIKSNIDGLMLSPLKVSVSILVWNQESSNECFSNWYTY